MFAVLLKLVPLRDYAYAAIAIAAVFWYIHHNHVEQALGAQRVVAAVAEANRKADADAQAKIAALTKQYDSQLAQTQVSYEKQLADASAQHDADVQRLLQLESSGSGTPNPAVGSPSGPAPGSPGGSSGAPEVGSLPTDLYVPASVALTLADALRHDDAQLQSCWAERDSLTGK